MDNYQGPGVYRHYKGGMYEVIGLGPDEATVDKEYGFDKAVKRYVVYRPLTPGSMLEGTLFDFWLRELDDFNAEVQREHGPVPRFEKVALVPFDEEDLVIRVCECGVVCEAFRATARCGRDGRHNMSYECPFEVQRVVAAEALSDDEVRERSRQR